MKKVSSRVISMLLTIILLLTGLPAGVSFAATEELSLSTEYDANTGKAYIGFPLTGEPEKVTLTFHDPEDTYALTTKQTLFTYSGGRVRIGIDDLAPVSDYIYDFDVKVYMDAEDTEPSHEGMIYYLDDLTFTGESFNMMSGSSGIVDKEAVPIQDGSGNTLIKSGADPKIRLKWEIPQIYIDGEGKTVPLTDPDALEKIQESDPIDKICFKVTMEVGRNKTQTLNFSVNYSNGLIIPDTGANAPDVSEDKDENGIVTAVILDLDKDQGIQPGTEYSNTRVGLSFEDGTSEPIPLDSTGLGTRSGNWFTVENIDEALEKMDNTVSSIYTPMQMEITRVDTDKAEVRFKKITNHQNYNELHYQVQYATLIDDLYDPENARQWVKIPDSSLDEDYGSEVITIPDENQTGFYIRVVYFDNSSLLPISSSLCISSLDLGADTGKPPLPRDIKAEAVYTGRSNVTIPKTSLAEGTKDDIKNSAGNEVTAEIPLSDLRLSFEKPQGFDAGDFSMHVLLSTYLPDSQVETRARNINPDIQVYSPVKQKRVLVLGEDDFEPDPEDPENRIVCTIPGDNLFNDYTKDINGDGAADSHNMPFENDEDLSGDGLGDYPAFLLPNTTYYVQIFTSKTTDNGAIDAGYPDNLTSVNISYKSPVISFTTWPLTETPVPMPDIELATEPEVNVDPVTGDMTFEGISVKYERVMTEDDWHRYTSATAGRAIEYEIYLSRNPAHFDSQPLVTDVAEYPEESGMILRSVEITDSDAFMNDGTTLHFTDPIGMLPNTVYYIKARSSLKVGGEVIGHSAETAVKAITTPKTESGGIDNDDREPRAPVEFSIAAGPDGEPRLSDASVTLNWLHAEDDVTYEMICTAADIQPRADESAYADDLNNKSLLDLYPEFRTPTGELAIDINDPSLREKTGLTVDEDGRVLIPVSGFLRPNRTYFFSLRAVRVKTGQDGSTSKIVSPWITVPVTTPMIQAPVFLEAVKDLELGFHIECGANGTSADSMEVWLKKSEAADSRYVRLNRSQYSVVMDGTTVYFRIYNLESDQQYDIKIKNNTDGQWYDSKKENWSDDDDNPVSLKTRNTFHEIEVRWEGEAAYEYYLEARAETDEEYEKLDYDRRGFTDYGYDLPSGERIEFYREKTNLYVEEDSDKYIYYARITGKPVKNEDGRLSDLPLKSNTTYYIKLWAYNLDESIHVGPVEARTDFSQDDYDHDKEEDDTEDLFLDEADRLTQKLYWLVGTGSKSTVRALLKDEKLTGLLSITGDSAVTVDLSAENESADCFEILIPYKILETIEKNNSRLSLKLPGAEITLNRGSIDLSALKSEALSSGAKEAMVLFRVTKSEDAESKLPTDVSLTSGVYSLDALAIGSKLTYAEISDIVYDILKDPDASGPFEYGILDRELTEILSDLDDYGYRDHTDLRDLIKSAVSNVEKELSGYLRDVIDGGSGYRADFRVKKAIEAFGKQIGVKLEYRTRTGYITPYVNYGSGWEEPEGARATVTQHAVFRAEKPGEYAVVGTSPAIVQPGIPADGPVQEVFSRYDLTRVFGKGTIYPDNPVKGEQALMLYAVLIHREDEMTGMSPAKKASALGVGDVMGARQLTGYVDNQTSVSLAVKLYCSKANINPDLMKPSRTIVIANGGTIDSRLYRYVVIGIDLDIITLENKRFDAAGRTTAGSMLEMAAKVLEKFE